MATYEDITAKPAVKIEKRTWRANIETPKGGAYSIQVYRQSTKLDEDDTVVGGTTITTPVNRMASAIAGESVTLYDGTVVSAAHILLALPLFFDRWALEDEQQQEPL